ncbi:hypothetical protein GCM10010387_39700 [Streptomyces inusitatus]|uniref:DUF202 domain-containing protein n=1 Tax=Streptomyces inusitatus TaxID=68221 RepID=A0A918UXF0_9ACTN|nr:DUF202 domain-containing protein [Streptomyces inusitatus]GGZ41400.1 hypothetical protein GCM10010387_39700 [Streptomyces inusitatus]
MTTPPDRERKPEPEPEPVPERDPGLQPERTRLAWRRTTLAFTVAAVFAGRQAVTGGTGPVGTVAVALSVLVWLGFLLLAHRRVRTLGAGPVPSALPGRMALTAVVCTVGLAGFAVAVVV